MPKRRRQGEGSIYQRADGRWLYAVVEYVGGKRRTRTLSASTHRELLRKMRADEQKRAELAVAKDLLDAWIERWLDACAARGLKPTTIAGYRSKLTTHVLPTLGKTRVADLTADHVRGVWSRMRDAKLSEATIRHTYTLLHGVLAAAVEEGLTDRNPTDIKTARPKVARPRPHEALTWDEARTVITAQDDPRDLARVYCALVLGLRQGEALGLRWDDINLDTGEVRIQRTIARVKRDPDKRGSDLVELTPKSEASVRTLTAPTVVLDALRAWHRQGSGTGYVFHGHRGSDVPEGSRRDWQAWRDALTRARVRLVPLHGARGTATSQMLKAGIPDRVIADTLGHDVAVSRRHYQHTDAEQRADALRALKPVASPVSPDEPPVAP